MAEYPDEINLVNRFKAGDSSAFEELVRAYQDRIFNLCRYVLGNDHDAEDAAQDVFIKAFRNLSGFKPDASVYTWLYRIAVNTCLDRKRKPFFLSLFKSGESEDGGDYDVPSEEPSPEKLLESKQISREIQRALNKISPKLRTVIVLKEFEGLSYEEIGEVLDISLGTVKSRISRAREELKELLKIFREQKLPRNV